MKEPAGVCVCVCVLMLSELNNAQ